MKKSVKTSWAFNNVFWIFFKSYVYRYMYVYNCNNTCLMNLILFLLRYFGEYSDMVFWWIFLDSISCWVLKLFFPSFPRDFKWLIRLLTFSSSRYDLYALVCPKRNSITYYREKKLSSKMKKFVKIFLHRAGKV